MREKERVRERESERKRRKAEKVVASSEYFA
jgi:hypothetical protein